MNRHFWENIDQQYLIGSTFHEKGESSLEDVLDHLSETSKFVYDGMTKDFRKDFAVNYTLASVSNFMSNSIDEKHHITSVIDPFCGTGRLIISYISTLGKFPFPQIFLNEYMVIPLLIAYYRVLSIFRDNNQPIQNIHVRCGNGFELIDVKGTMYDNWTSIDLVLMNPPFTRIHRIPTQHRQILDKKYQSYSQFLSGQPGLHIYAIILTNHLLSQQGKLATVLPISTFISDYSQAFQSFIFNNFTKIQLTLPRNSKSLSEGSDVREVILQSVKSSTSDEEVVFAKFNIGEAKGREISTTAKIAIEDLLKQKNWLVFFQDQPIRQLRNIILGTGFIKSGKQLNYNITRGLEMYGPDYFFLPNKQWEIVDQNDHFITVKNQENVLTIPQSNCIPSLRKPSLYQNVISPIVNERALSISQIDEQNNWLIPYNKITKSFAHPAIKKFQAAWQFHTYAQLKAKKPFGHLFLLDKIPILTSSIVAHYTKTKITCTKNFYVIKNLKSDAAKIQAAWLNSSIYFFLYLLNRREIGGSYGRMQISDFKTSANFLDVEILSENQKEDVISLFNEIHTLQLPPYGQSETFAIKRKLDNKFLEILNFTDCNKVIEDVYVKIQQLVKDISNRD